jgi:hypothetical protein
LFGVFVLLVGLGLMLVEGSMLYYEFVCLQSSCFYPGGLISASKDEYTSVGFVSFGIVLIVVGSLLVTRKERIGVAHGQRMRMKKI